MVDHIVETSGVRGRVDIQVGAGRRRRWSDRFGFRPGLGFRRFGFLPRGRFAFAAVPFGIGLGGVSCWRWV